MTGTAIAGMCLFIALVVAGACIPLYRGDVGMNNFYGIRLPAALRSEDDWYRINRIGGKLGIVCGAVYGAIATVFLVAPPTTRTAIMALAWSPAAMILAWVGFTLLATRRR